MSEQNAIGGVTERVGPAVAGCPAPSDFRAAPPLVTITGPHDTVTGASEPTPLQRSAIRGAKMAMDRRDARVSDRPAPVQCTVGSVLCTVRVWTESQWQALAPQARPTTAAYVPGLGWVGAVPSEHLN